MSRSALRKLDDIDALALDSLIYIDDEADPRASAGRDNGLSIAPGAASVGPDGLDIAEFAPGGTPAPSSGPLASAASTGDSDAIVVKSGFANANPWGGPGGPFGGGDDPDPPADPGDPPTDYLSGDDTVADNLEFNVYIDFVSAMDQKFVDLFEAAADWLSWLITEDIVDYAGVDDIRIEASIVPIDGLNGTLGRAGPTLIRGSGSEDPFLPIEAIMEFDVADMEALYGQDLADDVIVHEMMHSIGFGTVWDYFDGLLAGRPNGRSADLEFTGAAATAANGGNRVDVETDGGRGTAGAHWNEDGSSRQVGYDNELMTGFLEGKQAVVKAFTVASLEDIGYATQWNGQTGNWVTPSEFDPFVV